MNVTALLAHPDDELSCAGSLAKFVDAGHNVNLIIAFSDNRGAELHKSASILGANLIEHVGDQSQFVWNQEQVIKYDKTVSATEPDIIISHRIADHNTSHVPLAQIARTVARKNACELWEIDSALPGGLDTDGPKNNTLVDIDGQWVRKFAAISAYESVAKDLPGWASAFRHRDLHNGWLLHNDIHAHYAEAMRLVKFVWR